MNAPPSLPTLSRRAAEEDATASITISDLDEEALRGLRAQAAARGTSMEEEARRILRQAVRPSMPAAQSQDLGSYIHGLFAPLGGADMPERES